MDITPQDLQTILSIDVERWRQQIGFRQTHLSTNTWDVGPVLE